MSRSEASKILILMTGSIACYKTCYLISKLVQQGHEVRVAASGSALKFVGLATLEGLSQNPVAHDTFAEGAAMAHIHLIRWADLILVMPATAHFINRVAQGLGDDLLSTLYLAHDFKKPFLIAPAMNSQMYLHPATQNSIKTLKSLGITILETASGVLACGEEGLGKLLDPDLIYAEIMTALKYPVEVDASKPQAMSPALKVLITWGGCLEAIDSVRALTNLSSGQTGARLADHLSAFGFSVTAIRAETAKAANGPMTESTFTDFASLSARLDTVFSKTHFDVVIHAAAVSDYGVAGIETASGPVDTAAKIKSDADELLIRLKRHPKLLSHMREKSGNPDLILIGFKLTSDEAPDAITKDVNKQITESGCDFVVQNSLKDIHPEPGRHRYHLYDKTAHRLDSVEGAEALAAQLAQLCLQSGKGTHASGA